MIGMNANAADRPFGKCFLDYAAASRLMPPHTKCVLNAMRNYGICLISVSRIDQQEPFNPCDLEDVYGFVAIISDDTPYSLGPDRFNSDLLKGLIAKTSCAAIISTEPVIGIYDTLSLVAGQRQTGSLVVETEPEHEVQWVERIRAFSPQMPLIISTQHPEKMAKFAWPDMSGDVVSSRKHS